jgi:hypothetical protein
VTVAYNEHTKAEAHAKHQEPVLIFRVIGIEETNGILIEEDCLRFLKGDFVFTPVLLVLSLVPLEPYLTHTYNVCTTVG